MRANVTVKVIKLCRDLMSCVKRQVTELFSDEKLLEKFVFKEQQYMFKLQSYAESKEITWTASKRL